MVAVITGMMPNKNPLILKLVVSLGSMAMAVITVLSILKDSGVNMLVLQDKLIFSKLLIKIQVLSIQLIPVKISLFKN